MGLTNLEAEPVTAPSLQVARNGPRTRRATSEFETDVGQLYLRTMDEPVPARLLGILRAALAEPKS